MKALVWTYSPIEVRPTADVRTAMEQWAHARSLGMQVESLEIDGRRLTPEQLRRLNLFVEAGIAAKAAKRPQAEAETFLRGLLPGEPPPPAASPETTTTTAVVVPRDPAIAKRAWREKQKINKRTGVLAALEMADFDRALGLRAGTSAAGSA